MPDFAEISRYQAEIAAGVFNTAQEDQEEQENDD